MGEIFVAFIINQALIQNYDVFFLIRSSNWNTIGKNKPSGKQS